MSVKVPPRSIQNCQLFIHENLENVAFSCDQTAPPKSFVRTTGRGRATIASIKGACSPGQSSRRGGFRPLRSGPDGRSHNSIMSIWGKIIGGAAGFALGGPLGALLGAIAGHAVDVRRDQVEDDQPALDDRSATKQIAFTISVIVLGAKMAKADGIVSRAEVAAFKEVFHVPQHELANVGKLFDQAKNDTAGFEPYAKQVARMFPRRPSGAGRTARRPVPHRQGRRQGARRGDRVSEERGKAVRFRRGGIRPHPRKAIWARTRPIPIPCSASPAPPATKRSSKPGASWRATTTRDKLMAPGPAGRVRGHGQRQAGHHQRRL